MGAAMGGMMLDKQIRDRVTSTLSKSPLASGVGGGGLTGLAIREMNKDRKKKKEEKKNVNLPSSGTSIMDRY